MPINYDKTSSTLKTPEEYGIQTLERMYNALVDQWFRENAEATGFSFPAEIEFTFSDARDHLGMFKSNVQYRTQPDGGILKMTATDFEIEFSNVFRLTPMQLLNVMAHEMVHMFVTLEATVVANEMASEEYKCYRKSIEEDISDHGEQFRKVAAEVNRDLGLNITVTNDQPIIQNDGTSRSTPGAKVAHLLVTRGKRNDEACVVGTTDTKMKVLVMKLSAAGIPFRIVSTRDPNVIVSFTSYDDPEKIVTSITKESYLSELEESGVITDTTEDFKNKTGEFVPGKFLCVTDGSEVRVTRCTDDMAGTNALIIAKATGNPVGIYGVTDIYDDDVAVQSEQFNPEGWKDYTLHCDDYTMQQMVDDGALIPEMEVSPDGSVETFSE